ncbi:methylated-DNA-protein-cysteine methyltransferase related protein [Amphibacillus marinus]|uniref:Methylated-DNA-protein-cysteine methyltransferase related protein n=1 Tax=Amphibacillus marinus TaxID=872970 RepID=A0A1H8QST1_9BACI|nr:methylated-DNA--[protein]-cysteine S-methyltransferase [Amphibacillus marinus]SEO57087.1 methylated-DNA-protein-cysteine methyltransferase related protein [Amphibacillus marinus]
MNPFTEKVIELIQTIPSGTVRSYGDIAKEAGNPRGARQVARILHSSSKKYNLPWHRVVNAQHQVSLPAGEARDTQILRLRQEGVNVTNGGKIVY